MVDFKKLMEEDKSIVIEVSKHLENLNKFRDWLRAVGCERVYEVIEKMDDNTVIFKSEGDTKPSISIWLPKWW